MNKFMEVWGMVLVAILTLRIALVYVAVWDVLSIVGWTMILAFGSIKLAENARA